MGGVWGEYPYIDPFLVHQQGRRNSSLGEKIVQIVETMAS